MKKRLKKKTPLEEWDEKRNISIPPPPRLWTDFMTVAEVRASLENPLLMPGDLTNIKTMEMPRDGGYFRLEATT